MKHTLPEGKETEQRSDFGSKTGQLNGPSQSSASAHVPGLWPAFSKHLDGEVHSGEP